ncbi:MAG: DUF559 domain-containing protein [Rickettsiales bacterium]|nr:DUF559 domain-containing protein [Rickettsiales bacterium]
MSFHPENVLRAKKLRKNMSEPEVILWSAIQKNQLGFQFRRQYQLWKYYIDFVCIEKKIAIELDGEQHGENRDYDNRRTEFIKSQGWTLVRIPNYDIRTDLKNVIYRLQRLLIDDYAKSTDLFHEKW